MEKELVKSWKFSSQSVTFLAKKKKKTFGLTSQRFQFKRILN